MKVMAVDEPLALGAARVKVGLTNRKRAPMENDSTGPGAQLIGAEITARRLARERLAADLDPTIHRSVNTSQLGTEDLTRTSRSSAL